VLRASLGTQFFGTDIAAWYLAVDSKIAMSDLAAEVQNRQHFELTSPTRIGRGYGGLQLRHEPDPPPGLPLSLQLHYFRIEHKQDPLLQDIWKSVQDAGQVALSRKNQHLNFSEASFRFYAVLQPKPLEPDEDN
jgi:hypothetical protein